MSLNQLIDMLEEIRKEHNGKIPVCFESDWINSVTYEPKYYSVFEDRFYEAVILDT